MRLNLAPSVEPYALFEGIVIQCRPALTEVIEEVKVQDEFLAISEEIRDLVAAAGAEPGDGGEIALTPEILRANRRVGVVFAKLVARQVVVSWEGVEDPDGSPAPVTPERIGAFLDVPAVFDRFSELYLARWLLVQQEKNASAPSPTGTSAGATATARPARKSARSARAKSTGRKPKKAG